MKILRNLFLLIFSFFITNTVSAQIYVTDPAACPNEYMSQTCTDPPNVCGLDDTIVLCYDTVTIEPKSTDSSVSSGDYNPSGGFHLNCIASKDTVSPFCDQNGDLSCLQKSICRTQNRITTCLAGTWGQSECSDCKSGYNDCDDNGSCETQNGTNCYIGGLPGTWSGCTCVTKILKLGPDSVGKTYLNQSSSFTKMSIDGNGVFIGSSTSSVSFNVFGATTLSSDLSMAHNKSIQLNDASTSTVLLIGNYGDGQGFGYGTSTSRTASLAIEGDVKANRLCIKEDCRAEWTDIQGVNYWTLNGTNIYNNTAGNVGIGDDVPSNKLSVIGNIAGSGSLRITGTATSSNYFVSDLGIGSFPSGYWNRLVDLSGSGNSAYISRTGNTHAIMAASDTGTPVGTGYDFIYRDHQMVLGTITKHPLNFIIGGKSRMFLSDDGKLGIGTTAPGHKLEVVGADNNLFTIRNTGSAQGTEATLGFKMTSAVGTTNYAEIGAIRGSAWNISDIVFRTGNSGALAERVRISAAGNLGVGTTAPMYELDVNGFTNTKSIYEVSSHGLVGAWSLNKKNSLGSAGSEKILDSSGENNHGINTNALFTADMNNVLDGAMIFDGNADRINVGTDSSLNITGAITIEAWVKPTSYSQHYPIFVRKGDNYRLGLQGVGNGRVYFRLILNGVTQSKGSSSVVPIGTWTHVVGTYDGSYMRIYINGEISGTPLAVNGLIDITANPLIIGAYDAAGTYTFDGSIANVRLYNRSLSQNEIKQSYLQKAQVSDSYVSQRDVIVDATGNVGIGTTTPEAKLDVNGSLSVSGAVSLTGPLYTTEGNRLLMVDNAGSVTATTTLSGVSMPSGILGQTLRYGSTSWEATSTVFVKSDGNVGIGEDTPTNKLAVSGNITGSGSLSITGTATSSNYFMSNLGIGSLPSGFWNKFVDLSGSGNVAYISKTGNTHAIMAASDTGTPTGTGYNFTHTSHQMVLGTITNHPINFITNGTSKMFLTNDGKLGIGTTSPASALHIYPQNNTEGLRVVSSNYSPLVISTAAGVDLFRVNQSGDVTAVTSSATRMRSNNYCDANGDNCFDPSSGWSSAGYFATVTTATYSGNNNNNPGYAYAHARCNDQLAGTHVCSAEEILNTIRENKPMPSVNVWIFNGPPGFEAVANDCAARSTNLAAAGGKNQYGSYWQAPASETPLGKGLLMQCNVVLSLACCR